MQREEMLVRIEVVCGVLWMLSDGSWLMQWQIVNLVAGILAIVCAVAIFFYQERRLVPMLVCCAGTCWLLMNVLWSVGDMAEPKIESFISTAQIMFFAALFFMAAAFMASKRGQDISHLVLRRVRLLRDARTE